MVGSCAAEYYATVATEHAGYVLYRALVMCGVHAGMENQYRKPMDQYQNIAILYILNQKCMILIIEKSKHRDV